MLHEPAAVHAVDEAAAYKKRLGLIMLAVYSAIYVVFIVLNVVRPKIMGTILFSGLNLAIIYGFALILVALLLALVYNWACTRHEKTFEGDGQA
jgi:uncharacterized membrane protein (DUF485 family)